MVAHRLLVTLTLLLAVFATSASAGRSVLDPALPREPLNTLADISQALRGCWRWPSSSETTPGVEFTIQVSFKSNGELFGYRITYLSEDISDSERTLYAEAMQLALARCTPLPLSTSLGEAIAGRPMIIRIHDTQRQRTLINR